MAVRVVDGHLVIQMLETLYRYSSQEIKKKYIPHGRFTSLISDINKLIKNIERIVDIIMRKYVLVSPPSKGIDLVFTPQYAYNNYPIVSNAAGMYMPNEDKIVIFLFNTNRVSTVLIHEYIHYILHKFDLISRILKEFIEDLYIMLRPKYNIDINNLLIEIYGNFIYIEEAIVNIIENEYYSCGIVNLQYYPYVINIINILKDYLHYADVDELYNIIMKNIWNKISKVSKIIRHCIKKPLESPSLNYIFRHIYRTYVETLAYYNGSTIVNPSWFFEIENNMPNVSYFETYLKML